MVFTEKTTCFDTSFFHLNPPLWVGEILFGGNEMYLSIVLSMQLIPCFFSVCIPFYSHGIKHKLSSKEW